MRRRFSRWAILTLILLLGSSAVGLVVRGVIQPRKPDNYYNYGYRSSTVTVTPARPELTAGPQGFQATRKPTLSEPEEYSVFFKRLQNDHAQFLENKSNPYVLLQHFHTHRMAEEWVRFGVNPIRGTPPATAESMLNTDESTISSHLPDRVAYDAQTFRSSKVEIVWIANSVSGSDRAVLAKHTTSVNGARCTWYCRWWFAQQYGQWKLYDYEEQPHRLRVGAILADRYLAYNGATANVDNPKESLAAVDDIISATGTMMANHGWKPVKLGDALRHVAPLRTMQQALSVDSQSRRAVVDLQQALVDWPGSPVVQLMIASCKRDTNPIATYRTIAGGDTWADVLEASILREKRDTKLARDVLIRALKDNAGHPMLLAELYAATPAEERADLGTQAARGIAPAAAIRRLFQANVKDDPSVVKVVEAYRAILPQESEGCLAQAVVDAAGGDRKSAATHLATAQEEADGKAKADLTARFLKLYSARSGKPGNTLANDANLGPLLK